MVWSNNQSGNPGRQPSQSELWLGAEGSTSCLVRSSGRTQACKCPNWGRGARGSRKVGKWSRDSGRGDAAGHPWPLILNGDPCRPGRETAPSACPEALASLRCVSVCPALLKRTPDTWGGGRGTGKGHILTFDGFRFGSSVVSSDSFLTLRYVGKCLF